MTEIPDLVCSENKSIVHLAQGLPECQLYVNLFQSLELGRFLLENHHKIQFIFTKSIFSAKFSSSAASCTLGIL